MTNISMKTLYKDTHRHNTQIQLEHPPSPQLMNSSVDLNKI